MKNPVKERPTNKCAETESVFLRTSSDAIDIIETVAVDPCP
jgi:hypothetical protein